MPKVNANTVVQNPDTFEVVTLSAGDDVPAWASDLIGKHLIGDPVEAPLTEQGSVTVGPPQGGDSTPGEPGASSDVPDEDWTIADLRAYAKANDIDLHGATSKADILAAING